MRIRRKLENIFQPIGRICRIYRNRIRAAIFISTLVSVIFVFFIPNIFFPVLVDAQAERAWKDFEDNQLIGLYQAIKIAKNIPNIPSEKNLPKFKEYITVKPLYILQKILQNIYLANYRENSVPAKTIAFDPINNQFVESTTKGNLSFYNFRNMSPQDSKSRKLPQAVTSVSYCKNLIAVASRENSGTIRLYTNNNSMTILDTKDSIGDWIKSMSCSTDGKSLVTGSADGEFKLWKIEENVQQNKFTLSEPIRFFHGLSVEAVSFHPNMNIFAVAGEVGKNEEEIRLLNADTKSEISKISTDLSQVSSISFSPTQELLAAAGDERICLWDISDKTLPELRLCIEVKGVKFVSFSPSAQPKSQLIAAGSEDGKIHVLDYSLKGKAVLKSHYQGDLIKGVSSLSFSFDGAYLITSGEDKTTKLWKLLKLWDNQDILALPESETSPIKWMDIGIASNEDRQLRVAIYRENKKLKIWDLSSEIEYPRATFELVSQTALLKDSSDRYFLIIFGADRIGKFYTLSKEETKGKLNTLETQPFNRENSEIENIAISGDGSRIALAYKDSTVSFWDGEGNLDLERIHPIHEKEIKSMSFSDDGKYFAATGEDYIPKLWNLFTPNKLTPINWSQKTGDVAIIKINQPTLVMGGKYGMISLWDLEGKFLDKQDRQSQGHSEEIKFLEFSPDGQYFATLDIGKKAILWKKNGRKIEKKLDLPNVSSLAFSPEFPNGVLMATAETDGTDTKIVLRDLKAREVAEFNSEMLNVTHLRFSPDRKDSTGKSYENYIVAGDDQGTVKAWKINSADELIRKGCEWLREDYKPKAPECLDVLPVNKTNN